MTEPAEHDPLTIMINTAQAQLQTCRHEARNFGVCRACRTALTDRIIRGYREELVERLSDRMDVYMEPESGYAAGWADAMDVAADIISERSRS